MSLHHATTDGMTLRTLGVFIALTFALTWGLGALLFMAPDQVQAVFGPVSYSNPLFILAVYSPGIAAIVLVLFHREAQSREDRRQRACKHLGERKSCTSGWRALSSKVRDSARDTTMTVVAARRKIHLWTWNPDL